jgi:DNA-binding FadR family transcriptional regulator
MFLDRQSSNDVALTQEHTAELMGVRRESVTEAASRLQIAGAIRCSRGRISVVERTGLEARACECYGNTKQETDRLLEISRRYTKMRATQAAVYRIRIDRSDPSIANASQNFA